MLLSEVIGRDREIYQEGGGSWVALCPWHKDTAPSLKISDRKDLFKCFVCGKGGRGAISYIMMSKGLGYRESVQLLKSEFEEKEIKQYTAPLEETVYCLPLDRFKKPSFNHYIYGAPTNIYEYRNLAGRLLGYTCRYQTQDGGKVVLPYNYIMVNGSEEWVFKGFRSPSLPYKAELVHPYPSATICIVEGEKVADWALEHTKRNFIFISWVGGANNVKNVDWSCLKGRNVIFIPDHDKESKDDKGELRTIRERPGNKAMLEIAEIVKPITKSQFFVVIPEEYPHKWDLADRKWNPGDLGFWINKNKQEYSKLKFN